jgi:hypothetical protein
MVRIGRLAVLVALLVGFTLSGCADRSGPGVAAGASRSVGGTACAGDPGAARLVLTEAASGSRRCLSAHGAVEVYLHGTAADRWSPVGMAGTGLRAVASGKGAVPVGVTAGFFAGTGPGETRLTAFRSPCVTADPAAAGCDGTHFILITVVLQ